MYCEIAAFDRSAEAVRREKPMGLILSGGPASVVAAKAPLPDEGIFDLGIPVLGICYGLQVMGRLLGGEVDKAARREFGHAALAIDDETDLFKGLGASIDVWMSHGDHLIRMPEGFVCIGHTANASIAAMADRRRNLFGVQFHPEVAHTPRGRDVLRNFVFNVCGCTGHWTPQHFIETCLDDLKNRVGKGRILCGLSGGVDSAVVAELLHRAVGDRLVPVFVDNGLLRKNEARDVLSCFRHLPVRFVDASALFLKDLRRVVDPEEKRKRIGRRFIRIFEEEAMRNDRIDFLAQGTLYPDVIESVSTVGPSATIKSHHNVGGLPEKMKMNLVEPLRELFKDEVRTVGRFLGMPEAILGRHPFPGPGLAVRVVGEITEKRLALLREADDIFIQELRRSGWYEQVWQAFAVLLPVQTVGVMGDERTYENVVALRAVVSRDGMTADWAPLPPELLKTVSNRIINEVRGINRMVYDVSSKPPSTIEWE